MSTLVRKEGKGIEVFQVDPKVLIDFYKMQLENLGGTLVKWSEI